MSILFRFQFALVLLLLGNGSLAAQTDPARDSALAASPRRLLLYTSYFGGGNFFDDAALISWLRTQHGFSDPDVYYKIGLINVEFYPKNRFFIGCTLLDRTFATPLQGGPKLAFNVNGRMGVRIFRNKFLLDVIFGMKYSTMRVDFDAPPPYYQAEVTYYTSQKEHRKNFDGYQLYNSGLALEPALRFGYQFRTGNEILLSVNYYYLFYQSDWEFLGEYPTTDFPYSSTTAISERRPPELRQNQLTRGIFVQLGWGFLFPLKPSKHQYYLYRPGQNGDQ